jgi:hypothetical protein
MIEVGQTITVRQISHAHNARSVTFRASLLRNLISQGQLERDAVVDCALQCEEFSEIYITNGGEFELVWYYRPDISTIQACMRWPSGLAVSQNARQQGQTDRIGQVPFGACPVDREINCYRHGHERGVLCIDARAVYARIRAGTAEALAIAEIIREEFPTVISGIVNPTMDFVVISYRRVEEQQTPASGAYVVIYGSMERVSSAIEARAAAQNGPTRYSHSPEPEQGNIQLRSQRFTDGFIYENFGFREIDQAQIETRCFVFVQEHDPQFLAPVSVRRRPELFQWEVIYSILPPLPVDVEEIDMDVARAERARRAERFRNDLAARQADDVQHHRHAQREQDEWERERMIAVERLAKEALEKLALDKEKNERALAKAAARVAKEKQEAENKTGLRGPRPNIISDDDSED